MTARGQRSMIRSLTVAFDQAVTLDADAITVIDESGTPVQVAVANPSGDQATYVVTFTDPSLTGESLDDGHYRMTVAADKVHSLGGLTLTDDHVTDFFRLFGDVDGDRDVDRGDYIQIRGTLGKSDGQAGFNGAFDYDGSGLVDALDAAQVQDRLDTWLDEPAFPEAILFDGEMQAGIASGDDWGEVAGPQLPVYGPVADPSALMTWNPTSMPLIPLGNLMPADALALLPKAIAPADPEMLAPVVAECPVAYDSPMEAALIGPEVVSSPLLANNLASVSQQELAPCKIALPPALADSTLLSRQALSQNYGFAAWYAATRPVLTHNRSTSLRRTFWTLDRANENGQDFVDVLSLM